MYKDLELNFSATQIKNDRKLHFAKVKKIQQSLNNMSFKKNRLTYDKYDIYII